MPCVACVQRKKVGGLFLLMRIFDYLCRFFFFRVCFLFFFLESNEIPTRQAGNYDDQRARV